LRLNNEAVAMEKLYGGFQFIQKHGTAMMASQPVNDSTIRSADPEGQAEIEQLIMHQQKQPEPRIFDCDKIDENKTIRNEIAQFLNGGGLSGAPS